MRIGIIGAECTHAAEIAKTINIQKKIKGFTVDFIWGETREFAEKAAREGQIPVIVKNPREMLGMIDGLVVDHRHAKYHLGAAIDFIKAGVPTFIDKPFCYRVKEGLEFIKAARKYKTPICSFSAVRHQSSFEQFLKETSKAGDVITATVSGPCDIKSKYGGVFFYGSHHVECAIAAFGSDIESVTVVKNGSINTAVLKYERPLTVSLNFIKAVYNNFSVSAYCSSKTVFKEIEYDNAPYLKGIKIFTKMFKTHRGPCDYENMLRPVAVLEAIEKALKTGQSEKVQRI